MLLSQQTCVQGGAVSGATSVDDIAALPAPKTNSHKSRARSRARNNFGTSLRNVARRNDDGMLELFDDEPDHSQTCRESMQNRHGPKRSAPHPGRMPCTARQPERAIRPNGKAPREDSLDSPHISPASPTSPIPEKVVLQADKNLQLPPSTALQVGCMIPVESALETVQRDILELRVRFQPPIPLCRLILCACSAK